MYKPDIFDLKEKARKEDLRNRVILVPVGSIASGVVYLRGSTADIPDCPEHLRDVPTCLCGNLLTISDFGGKCRECRRLSQS